MALWMAETGSSVAEAGKPKRKPPLSYRALFNKVPKQRPVAADTICGLFSDRELRTLCQHNKLKASGPGGERKDDKSKSLAKFFNSGQTGLEGMDDMDQQPPAAAAARVDPAAGNTRPLSPSAATG